MKDLGVAKKIFGMKIHRNRGEEKLFLSQKKYIEKVLERIPISEEMRREGVGEIWHA